MKILAQTKYVKYELGNKIYLENEYYKYTNGSYSLETSIYSDLFGLYFNYDSVVQNWARSSEGALLEFSLVDL